MLPDSEELTRGRLESLISASPAVLYALKVKGDTLTPFWVSNNITRLMGYEPEECLGHREWWIAGLHPDDREAALARMPTLLSTGHVIHEYRFRHKDGRYFWVCDELRVSRGRPGRAREIAGAWLDITERKRAEEEVRTLNEELERRVEARTAELRAAQDDLLRAERLAMLGRLTATVSHELRNPLGIIRTSASVLREGLKEEASRAWRSLGRIERSIIRCDRIIDELLDFTHISALEPEPTPVDAWLEETLKEQELPSRITLYRDLGLGDMTVPFDKDRFRRAIINVFDNACQAMIGKGPEDAQTKECVLTVRTQERNGRVVVTFEDTGPGIPPAGCERVFEPLYSTKSFGVGLGLPVVKQIMEQHGGGIEIESGQGRGTQVRLWLPIRQSGP